MGRWREPVTFRTTQLDAFKVVFCSNFSHEFVSSSPPVGSVNESQSLSPFTSPEQQQGKSVCVCVCVCVCVHITKLPVHVCAYVWPYVCASFVF